MTKAEAQKTLAKRIKAMIEMLIIISLVTAFGAWTLNEWYKRYPEPEKQVKVYCGKWHKTYLEVIK